MSFERMTRHPSRLLSSRKKILRIGKVGAWMISLVEIPKLGPIVHTLVIIRDFRTVISVCISLEYR